MKHISLTQVIVSSDWLTNSPSPSGRGRLNDSFWLELMSGEGWDRLS